MDGLASLSIACCDGPGGEGWLLADTGELCELMFAASVERPGYELGRPPNALFPYWSWNRSSSCGRFRDVDRARSAAHCKGHAKKSREAGGEHGGANRTSVSHGTD